MRGRWQKTWEYSVRRDVEQPAEGETWTGRGFIYVASKMKETERRDQADRNLLCCLFIHLFQSKPSHHGTSLPIQIISIISLSLFLSPSLSHESTEGKSVRESKNSPSLGIQLLEPIHSLYMSVLPF